jgi:hypothetical protein
MEANLDLSRMPRRDTASRCARRAPPTCRSRSTIFRYFAGCIRAQEGSIGEIDHDGGLSVP